MEGKNVVELAGHLTSKRVNETRNGSLRLQASLEIPLTYTTRSGETVSSKYYIPICAWGDIANAMKDIEEGMFVNVFGRLSIRKYDASCKMCEAPLSKKWAEVVVDNFVVV
jgi:single-stranded DNA-binding protein